MPGNSTVQTLALHREGSRYYYLPLPGTAHLKGIDSLQQIGKIEDCVFMVKGN